MNCINTSSPEYIKLLNESKFKPEILKAKISMWQEANGFDSFPTLQDLGINPSTVNSAMKALDLLTTNKAEKLFNTLNKNKVVDNIFWNKVQQDLGIPKEQVEILKSFNTKDRNKLITDLLANYSYTIEINTAKDKTPRKLSLDSPESFIDDFGNEYKRDYSDTHEGFDYFKNGNLITKQQFDRDYQDSLDNVDDNQNTQYYSNLTVPGGTNYTENEIATPAITPSIKGHAQFSTDKGIGWFRSDDEAKDNLSAEREIRKQYEESGLSISYEQYKLVKGVERGGIVESSKTRRILEVQSDLFQKGRDRDNLTGASINNKKYVEDVDLINKLNQLQNKNNPFDTQVVYEDKTYDREGLDGNWYIVGEISKRSYDFQNQFLQLLNKDNNWVTFFVKSIIQDSAKKGYEKVLFPTGNTASKVEGHQTLEEFKREKENRIKELEKSKKEQKDLIEDDLPTFDDNGNFTDKKITSLNQIDNEINQLKQELERVEIEGFGALKPIWNFYEVTVTNILKKQGYNPTLITDEYGNTWNEVSIKETDVAPIYYQLGGKLSPAQQEAKDLYFDRVHNKNLSETEVYQINKKLESISSQTGDLPWKLRKSTKGNWYIAGYKNKPVTMSDYYSPYGGEFRQIESKGTPNEALDNLIKIFITKAGFDIKVFDEIKTRTGENAVAAVDLFNRLVKIAKNKAGKDTLTEEAAHILVEMLGDNHPLVIKMMDTIEQTEVYQPTHTRYYNIYNGDINKIKKEAVGKMITKIALQKFERNEFNTTPETTWNKFVKLVQAAFTWLENKFKKVPDTFESEIDKLYGEASKMLLEGDTSQLQDIKSTEEFYQLDTDKKNKVDAVTEQIRRTKAQILRVKKQNPNWAKNIKISAFITKLEQYIKQLEEEKSIGIIEDKATRELAAIDKKIKDFDSIKDEDKEEFFSYSMDVIKGWKDLSEFINYEDVALQAKINELQGKALALEKKLVEVYQKWVETQDNVDMTSPIEDVSFFGANLLDIAQSNIPALQKIQEIINKALFKGYELYSQLDKKVDSEYDKLKKWADSQGLSNKELWDIFKQKDSKGNWTGNYVVETSQAYYEEKKRQKELADKSGSDKNLKAWLRANTVKTFDKEAYNEAYNQAVLEFTNNGIIDEAGLSAWVKANDENSYKSPFAEYSPNKKLWADKQYQYIQSVSELKEFYDFFINTLEERKQPLPKYSKVQSNYLPELKKGLFKDFAQNGMTGIATEWGKRMKDLFTTDVEGTMETLLRDPITGKPEKTIPVYMMSDSLDPNQKEYDLTKVLKAFGAMSYAYEQKSIVEEPIKLRTSLFRQLKEKLVAEGTEKRDRFGKLVEIFDGNKNALDLMEYYVDATLYGQTRFEDKSLTVAKTDEGKKKVTLTTILDQMINYTRLKGLTGNIFAATTNSIFATSSVFIYAEGKKDFTPKQATDAFGIMLNSIIRGSDTSKKVKFLMNKFRIKPDYVSSEGSNIGKYAYIFTEMGEYLGYGQSGIATLLNTEIKNLKGETKSLYDAYIVKDGEVIWNTKEFGPEQYEDLSEEKYNLYSKIQELNKKIHGNYDPDSPTRAKAHVVGRALLIFRTWLPMAIHSRFGSQSYSKALGRDVKGRYISGWEFIKENKVKSLIPVAQELFTQVLNTMTFNRLELESGAFENLSELDRENMLRNVAEIRFILFFMALGMLLRGMTLEDDDEEKVAMYKFLINQSDRVGGELKFFFSPTDQSRIIRDISPVSRTVADFYDLVPASFKFIMGEDEITRGPNKGKSNLGRQLKQAVPVITQIQKVEELADRNIDNPLFR